MTSLADGFAVVDRRGRRLLTITLGRVLLRVTVVGSMAAVVAVQQYAAPAAPLWPGLLLVLLAVLSAELPDTQVPLVTLAGAGAWWLLADGGLGWSVAVAAALLVFHVAVGHAACGPPGFTAEWRVLAGLVVDVAALVGVTAGVALAAAVAAGRFESPALLVAVALLGVGTLPWVAHRG